MHQTYVNDHICGMRALNVVNIMRAHHHIYMSTCHLCAGHTGDEPERDPRADDELNRELHAVFDNGLRPIILIGESETKKGTPSNDLVDRMETILDGIEPEEITRSLMVYEPEWAIGADEPAPPEYIAERATFMRHWLIDRFGNEAVQPIPIIYGGAVFPENAEWLLTTPDIDGLGAGRKSRDPEEFCKIAKIVARVYGLK